ncbi:MAG: hypothetical protein OES84_00210 [Kiritimatiellaceae bacterium]|nr:hypothetical protein [Kiritimatiellaceae bacterium]
MKSESFRLSTPEARENVIQRIKSDPCDGKTQVTIGPVGTKSARQRGLDWMWNTEIVAAGCWSTKEEVHTYCKERFGLPILIRDDSFFAELYQAWIHEHNPDKKEWFIENMIHTEKFSKAQMSEYLREKQQYFIENDIYLTHPDDRGLLT